MTTGRATPPQTVVPEEVAGLPTGLEPLAGVSSTIITFATRLVAQRWREEAAAQGALAPGDEEVVAGLVAALALAVDQRRPGYISELVPRPAPALTQQLVAMLQSELLRLWTSTAPAQSPSAILDTLNALEEVRRAVAQDGSQDLSTRFGGSQGLDLLVEVVHDLRSPLTSILFLAETLQRGQSGEVNTLQRRQLGLIYSAALGLSSLVSDAIELARGGDELADSAPSPFSTTELLESVSSIIRPISEEKGLAIHLVTPAVDHRLGHPVALSRVLLNLTTNALKFTEHGYVEISLEEKTGTTVNVAVRDTGPGINPESLAHLFRPFREARGRPGYCFSGTGLGLVITRKLVEAMGSSLRFETRPGWGTRFEFDLDLPPHLTRPTPPRPSLQAS